MNKFLSAILIAASLLGVNSCSTVKQDVKKISIMGDSYSTYEGHIPKNYAWWYGKGTTKAGNNNDVTKVDKTWWKQLTDTPGYILEVNDAFSGSTICTTGYDASDSTVSAFVSRYTRLGDPDIILIFGATNDSWAGSPIGDYKYNNITTEDKKSFRPALAFLLSHVKDFHKEASVYYILNTELKPEINESVHTICDHYEVPVIVLKNIDKQSGHPSVSGMRAIYIQVLDALEVPKRFKEKRD